MMNDTMLNKGGGYGYAFGGGGGGVLEGLLLGALFNRRGLNDGDGDSGCANARFLALESGQNQLSDQIQTNSVLGAIKDNATNAAIRFDAVQNNINQNQIQALLASERTNGNISEVKFQSAINTKDIIASEAETRAQNAVNFLGINNKLSECCCSIEKSIMEDGGKTRALIESNFVKGLEGKLAERTLELSQCRQNAELENLKHSFQTGITENNVNFGTQITQLTNAINSLVAKG